MITGNLFSDIPEHAPKEVFERLLETPHLKPERIISAGHATPPGKWYDPDTDEWVFLLSGAARLLYEGEGQPREMRPGDYVLIPARKRHRVEWTDPGQKTVWLALHH